MVANFFVLILIISYFFLFIYLKLLMVNKLEKAHAEKSWATIFDESILAHFPTLPNNKLLVLVCWDNQISIKIL